MICLFSRRQAASSAASGPTSPPAFHYLSRTGACRKARVARRFLPKVPERGSAPGFSLELGLVKETPWPWSPWAVHRGPTRRTVVPRPELSSHAACLVGCASLRRKNHSALTELEAVGSLRADVRKVAPLIPGTATLGEGSWAERGREIRTRRSSADRRLRVLGVL
jgi:hypothetical protein